MLGWDRKNWNKQLLCFNTSCRWQVHSENLHPNHLFSFKVIDQPCVQQSFSLLLTLLGFFIQTLDPQLISQVRIVTKLTSVSKEFVKLVSLPRKSFLIIAQLLFCSPFFVELNTVSRVHLSSSGMSHPSSCWLSFPCSSLSPQEKWKKFFTPEQYKLFVVAVNCPNIAPRSESVPTLSPAAHLFPGTGAAAGHGAWLQERSTAGARLVGSAELGPLSGSPCGASVMPFLGDWAEWPSSCLKRHRGFGMSPYSTELALQVRGQL